MTNRIRESGRRGPRPARLRTARRRGLGRAALALLGACLLAWGQAQTTYYQGTQITALDYGDDSAAGPQPIGFNFSYFGSTKTQFWASNNGTISFSGGFNAYSNSSLPAGSSSVVFGFWDDLMSYGPEQSVLYRTVPAADPDNPYGNDVLVVQWTNYGYYGSDLPFGTFQIVLESVTGTIRFNYLQLLTTDRSYGQSATIGLQDTSNAVQYSFNTEAVHPGESIVFTPSGGSYTYTAASSADYWDMLIYSAATPPPGAVDSGSISPASGATDVSLTPTLSWGASAGADSYRVVVSQSPTLNSPVVDATGITDTSYTVPAPLQPNTTYYWVVIAENEGGETYSEVQTFTTGSGSTNADPTDIALSGDSVGQSGGANAAVGTLSATDPDAGDSHTFALVAGPGSTGNGLFDIDGATLRVNDAAAMAAGDYGVRVRATDGSGGTYEESFTLSVIDDVAPAVGSVGVPAGGSYGVGDTLAFAVAFSEAVTVTGTPTLSLDVGGAARQADYASGSGSTTLVFRYTVQAGDLDGDGPAIGVLGPNGGTVRDDAGNDADLALSGVGSTAGIAVDGVAPTITGVSAPVAGTYGIGADLDFAVTLSEAVTVDTAGGTPRVALDLGGATRYATYVSGSGSDTLVFRYSVQEGDSAEGVAVGSDLELDGGGLADGAGNAATTALGAADGAAAVTVDAVRPTWEDVAMPAAGTYGVGDTLEFSVRFSESVDVGAGPLGLPLLDGGLPDQVAAYVSGSGSDTLTFAYTLQEGDFPDGAVSVGDSLHALASVTDAAGNAFTNGYAGDTDALGVVVDSAFPTVVDLETPAAGLYAAGGALDLVLVLDEAVTVDTTAGVPYLEIDVAGSPVRAEYLSGSGSDRLVFRWVVPADLPASGDLAVGAALVPDGGTLRDGAGNDALADLGGATPLTDVFVDGAAPEVVSVSAPADGTYGIGAALDFTVAFTEPVAVDTEGGVPTLALTVGGVPRQAVYVSGGGTDRLVFRYTVQAGDLRDGGVAVAGGAVETHGASLADAAGNVAVPDLHGVADASGVTVDGSRPTPLDLSPDGGQAANDSTVTFTVTFSEDVTGVDPSDFVVLATGTASGTVSAVTGSGSTYTVSVTDVAGTGAIGLGFAGGDTGIVNGAGNPLNTDGAASDPHDADLDPPVVTAVALESAGPFRVGDAVTFGVTMSEPVDVDGSPTLTFTVGGRTFTATLDPDLSSDTELVFRYEVTEGEAFSGPLTVDELDPGNGTVEDASGNGFDPASGLPEVAFPHGSDEVEVGGEPSAQVSPGAATPEGETLETLAGQTGAPVLQFTLERRYGAAPATLTRLKLRVVVTGNALDDIVGTSTALDGILAIHLVRDLDGDGRVDEGEPTLATATALDDDGETVTFVPTEPLVVGEDEAIPFLVTFDIED